MSILGSLLEPATKILDKVIEDKDQKNALAHEIATMAERHAQELAKGQLEVNKAEAAHKSLFVAGWRPFIGWICGVAMLANFLLIPMANFVLDLSGSTNTIPLIELETMMPVLMGMLGLGAMRSYEKVKKVSREN
jgi:hypothetical protein|tara:strand:- start:101 stop:505 length:405 start_codon:yes stop_codon:yes gene_type:complete